MLRRLREQTVALIRRLRAARIARPRRRMPRQLQPDAIRLEYMKAIIRLALEPARAAVERELVPRLPLIVADARRARGDRRDAPEDVNAALDEITDEFWRKSFEPTEVAALAATFADRTQKFNREQLRAQARAALGVDPFHAEPDLLPHVKAFVAENVALIKTVPNTYFDDVEKTVTAGVRAGVRHEDIARQLRERYGVAEQRAKLIARDQVGKFYGDLNRVRQKAMGVERYTWRSVNDNRVRKEHAERDGLVYEWSKPPADGHPGHAINCRCSPEPDFSDILDASSAQRDLAAMLAAEETAKDVAKATAPPQPARSKKPTRDETINKTREVSDRVAREEHDRGLEIYHTEVRDHLQILAERQNQLVQSEHRLAEIDVKGEAYPGERTYWERDVALMRDVVRAQTTRVTDAERRLEMQRATLKLAPRVAVTRDTVKAVADRLRANEILTSDEQATARAAIDDILAAQGLINRDAGRPQALRFELADLRGLAGAYHHWDGKIQVDGKFRGDVANAFDYIAGKLGGAKVELDGEYGLRVLLHEASHGHSPQRPASYCAGGAKIEEVATEVTARVLMRDYLGKKGLAKLPLEVHRQRLGYEEIHDWHRGGSYQSDIADVIVHVQKTIGDGFVRLQDFGRAVKLLEDASLKLKKFEGASATTPEEHARNFVDGFKLSKKKREELYKLLVSDMLNSEKRSTP